jgi:hypothetical protein
MLCKTPDQRKIFDRIGDRIEQEPSDSIGAAGTYSEIVAAQQRGYIQGLRSGRLAAIRAIDPS